MKRRTIGMVAALAVVGGLGAWAGLRGQRSTEYRTAPVTRGTVESTISATGNLNAVVMVQVGTQVSGNISQLYADFNSRVTKGQLVARIDPLIFEAQVNQAQANLDAARAAVGNAEAALEKADAEVSNAKAMLAVSQANLAKEKVSAANTKVTFDRQQALFSKGLIATADRDTAQATYDAEVAAVQAQQAQVQAASDSVRSAQAARNVAAAQVNTAKAQMNQQAAALAQARINLDHTYIYAPVDGVVVSRQVDVGQTVAASLQAPTIFQIAQDLTKMQVDTNVDESDVGHVQAGQQATFTVDAFPTRIFHGLVTQIRKAPINVQNVITYDVVIGVSNKDLKLFPGMTANVRILVDKREGALRIPNSALRFRPVSAASERLPVRTADGRRKPPTQAVWIVGQDGKPQQAPVQLGITDGTYSEVTGGDLSEGQQVIVGMEKETSQAATPFGGGPRRGPF
jgi:HlyD family secretion protein